MDKGLPKTQEAINFKIEEAKPEDVEKIRTIVRDAWLEIYPNETYGITREDIEAIDWFDLIGLEKRKKEIKEKGDTIHVWVLKDDRNNIVGFCKASKDGHKTNTEGQREIDAMYVAREFQGKGLGQKLMQKAVEWLGAEGDIRLEVVSYNSNAINFYEKSGFQFQEIASPVNDKRTQLPSGKKIPRIVMIRKKLQ